MESKAETLGYKELLLFSLPSILSSLLEPIASVVDTAFVGRLDTTSLAALAICVTIFNSFTWMFNFLVHASTHAIASVVKKNPNGINARIKVSFITALSVTLVCSLILFLIQKPLLYFSGANDQTFSLAKDYFLIRLYFIPFTYLYTTNLSILRGLSKVKESFWIVAITTLSNVVLTWYFLYEMKLGIVGAAWGTGICNLVGFVLCFIVMLTDQRVSLGFLTAKAPKDDWLVFGKNSLDLFGRSLSLTLAFYIATKFAAMTGVASLGAHQIMLQLWLFSSFFIDGIAITANVLGSESYHAGEIEKTRILFHRLLFLGGGIGLAFTVVYGFAEVPLAQLFTNDQEVLVVLSKYWPLVFLSQIVNAASFVYDGLIFGLGDFRKLRIAMILGVVLIFFPFASYTYFRLDLIGVWLGLIVLNVWRMLTGVKIVKSHIGVDASGI